MNAAIRTNRRGTRSASSARNTAGNVVVVASSTAPIVPIVAFSATVASTTRPVFVDGQRAQFVGRAARAQERDEDRDEQHERQHEAGAAPDLARRDPRHGRDRGEHDAAGGEHGPGGQWRRDGDDCDREDPDDLGAGIKAMDRARRVTGEPGQLESVVTERADGVSRRRRRQATP